MAKSKVCREGFTAGVKEAKDVSQNLHVIASALKSEKKKSERNGILPAPTGLEESWCLSGGSIVAAPERHWHDEIDIKWTECAETVQSMKDKVEKVGR